MIKMYMHAWCPRLPNMVGDVQLANGKLSIHLKSCKHSNQFSTKNHMQPVPHKYCPVKAFYKYINVRGQRAGPFFATRHCIGISRDKVAQTVRLWRIVDCTQNHIIPTPSALAESLI